MSFLYYFALQRKKLSNGFLTKKVTGIEKELTSKNNDHKDTKGIDY